MTVLFSSPEHNVLKVSFCDGPLSVVHRLCVNNWPNFTGMIPRWSLIKVVQTVSVGCINRSLGQKIGFQNAIFKNLLVRNYKAQGPGGHNFTLTYIRKTSNDIFSLTTNGNLTKLHRNDPWMVLYQSCSNRSSWLH